MNQKKYSAVFYDNGNGVHCTAKGSVEEILKFCSHSFVNGKKEKLNEEEILKQNDELASKGYRVIAICDGEIKGKK